MSQPTPPNPTPSSPEFPQLVSLSFEEKLRTLSGYTGYTEWSNYLKNGDMRVLDKVLHKCYECINNKQQQKNGRGAYDGNIIQLKY